MDTIRIGDQFTIRILIRNAENVFAVNAHLIYPIDALEIIQDGGQPVHTVGEFLGGECILMANVNLDETTGKGTIEMMLSLRGAQPERAGEGALLSITARALKAGRHALKWHSNSTVLNAQQVDQPRLFEEVEMTVLPAETSQQTNVVYIEIQKP